MPSIELEPRDVRRELEQVLKSTGFVHNERLSRFLRSVVERYLEGRSHELKESVLAIEVFGRSPDYDPKRDPIVRTEAGRLRARLSEYYMGEGRGDALIIELPKGGYTPAFRRLEGVPATSPASLTEVEPMLTKDRKPRLRRLGLTVGMACVTAASIAASWQWFHHPNGPIPIAVLPLNNLSPDSSNAYFADGLTGEIIRNLSIIDGLAVRSQTSSFVFKGKPQNVRDAAQQLDADYILEGSVLLAGRQLRINAQLVRVRDDFPMWTGRYDRELTDIFTIQDEISRSIVNSLRLKLGQGRRRYETSVEAYDLYLRARALKDGSDQQIAAFEQAIAKDPSFAPAYSGLASTHALRSGFGRFNSVELATEMSRMRAAAEKAVQLDPLLAEAHGALGMVYARDAQWEQSERSFRLALDRDPNSSLLRDQFVLNFLLPLGRIEAAVAQARLAEKSDPLSREVQSELARALFMTGRLDEAAIHCQEPCIEALLLQGRANEAIPDLEARFHGDLSAAGSGALGRAYALAGRRADAERIATIQWRPIPQAAIFAALGDKDRAFEALNRAIPEGPVHLGRELGYPQFFSLRGDPRLKALRQKVGLPE